MPRRRQANLTAEVPLQFRIDLTRPSASSPSTVYSLTPEIDANEKNAAWFSTGIVAASRSFAALSSVWLVVPLFAPPFVCLPLASASINFFPLKSNFWRSSNTAEVPFSSRQTRPPHRHQTLRLRSDCTPFLVHTPTRPHPLLRLRNTIVFRLLSFLFAQTLGWPASVSTSVLLLLAW